MNRTSTGHPMRAAAGLAMLLVAWVGARVPAMRAEFERGLAMALGGHDKPSMSIPARVKSQTINGEKAAVISQTALPLPRLPALLPLELPHISHNTVIPAKAGTHLLRVPEMSPRFRGDDDPRMEAGTQTKPDLVIVAADNKAQYPSAFDLASAAYAKLATGDRHAGAELLDAAIAIGNPNASTWVRDRDALRRHWSGSAYVIARGSGPDLAGRPILGGGQSGVALAYALDPLAHRPISLSLRGSVANTDASTGVVAVGLNWRVFPQITLSAERLIPLGVGTRAAWTFRAAGGLSGHRFGVDTSAYAEAGIVGRARYAAAQARADVPLPVGAGFSLHPGAGAWASIQHDTRSVDRIDAGPGVRLRSDNRRLPLELSVDYRIRLTGNAAPGSGPVMTLSAAF